MIRDSSVTTANAVGFRYYLRVRYAECDAQKIVFNARYGDYIDLATTEFLRTLGFGDALIAGSLDYQLVKQTTEWKAPARFDDVLEIEVAAVRIGTTSFTLATTFRRAGDSAVSARSETVYVCVDARTLQKCAVSEDLRAALEAGAPGAFVDHAGYVQ